MKRSMKWIAVMMVVSLLAVAGAIAGENSITGTVVKTDQGIVISATDGDTYIVKGKDLSQMVGETIKATGTLAEEPSGKTLTITRIEPVEK
jgi:hypothetical protein